jgi:hypothetical protein
MTVREVIGRLTIVRNDLPRITQAGMSAQSTLNRAVQLINSVLDGVQDKSLAEDIAKHGRAVAAACASAESAQRDIDTAIQRFLHIGGR